ncbi:MAG: TolC family protein [Armatimonadetes bacterium]|nr:TolC family protein [Armatimonadota bacterium]
MNPLVVAFWMQAVLQVPTGPTPETGDQVLRLDDALSIAARNAFVVRIQETSVSKAESALRAATSSLGPRVSTSATYQRFEPSNAFGGNADSKTLGLTVGFPIDLGGYIRNAIGAARYNKIAAEQTLRTQSNNVRNQVRMSYYNVVLANWNVAVQQQSVKNAEDRLKNALLFEEQGRLAHYDVLRLQTALTQAQSALASAQNALTLSKQSLNNLLARPINTPFDVERTFSQPAIPGSPEQLEELGYQNRPEIKALEASQKAIEENKRYTSRDLAPQLNVGVSYNRVIDATPFQRENQVVGQLQLTWLISDSGVTKERIRQLELDRKQVGIQVEQTRLGVSLQVRRAILAFQNAQEQLAYADKQVAETEEAYRLATLLFENGRGITLDVTTAQENVTRAQAAQANARFALLTALADLQLAVGTDALPTTPGDNQ